MIGALFALLSGMDRAAVRSWVWLLAAVIGGMTVPPPAVADLQKARGPATGRTAAAQVERYQVASGTALLLKLTTPLNSATALIDDQVEAVLWSPVIQDGVELVPVGSVVFGKVVESARATDRTPTGSVTFVFKIIEHGETGSRDTLSTQKITLEAQRGPDTGRGRGRRRLDPVDVAVPGGMRLVAMTAEPLMVRIPR